MMGLGSRMEDNDRAEWQDIGWCFCLRLDDTW